MSGRRDRFGSGGATDGDPAPVAAPRTLRRDPEPGSPAAPDEIDRAFAVLTRIARTIREERCSEHRPAVESPHPAW